MRFQILLVLSVISLSITAQKVVLDIQQNYIPVITQKGDTLISSKSSGNQWIMGGVLMQGENNQRFIVPQTGNYEVVVTDAVTGCSTYSESFQVIAMSVPNIRTPDFVYNVYPNPNNGLFNIAIDSDDLVEITLNLLTVDGKILAKQKFTHSSGKQVIQFGKSNLPSGVYTLQIDFGTKTIVRKLIVK